MPIRPRRAVTRGSNLLLLAGLAGCAAHLPAPTPYVPPAPRVTNVVPEDWEWLQAGTSERYSATLAGLPAGDATLRVMTGADPMSALLQVNLATSRWLAPLFRLEETITVHCDVPSRRPRDAEVVALTGGNESRLQLRFDADREQVHVDYRDQDGTKQRVLTLAEAVDPLTLIFLVRELPLAAGLDRTFHVVLGARPRRVRVAVDGLESMPWGEDDAEVPAWRLKLRAEPLSRKEERVDELQVWVGAEPAHPLLRVEVETPLGVLRIDRQPDDPAAG